MPIKFNSPKLLTKTQLKERNDIKKIKKHGFAAVNHNRLYYLRKKYKDDFESIERRIQFLKYQARIDRIVIQAFKWKSEGCNTWRKVQRKLGDRMDKKRMAALKYLMGFDKHDPVFDDISKFIEASKNIKQAIKGNFNH